MPLYKFRIIFEDQDEVQRDIEIMPFQTFGDFHLAIQEAIGFDGKHEASFYLSDDSWRKGAEITSVEKEGVTMMDNAVLSDYILSPRQKIYYVYDPASGWTFFIELFKILPEEDDKAQYPRCVKSVGTAPKQYPPVNIPDPELEGDLFEDEEIEKEKMIEDEIYEEDKEIEEEEDNIIINFDEHNISDPGNFEEQDER